MADEHQVLFGRQLHVDALLLEDHADQAAHAARLFGDIVPHDERASACRNHQRRKNAERRRLAASVGPEQSEDLRRTHFERHARQRNAIAVLMAQILQLNYRSGRRQMGVSVAC